MSNADDIFWRRFGAILVGLTVFGFVVAFIARDIAGDSHRAAIQSPSAVAERIAQTGMVRVGDPAATVAAAPTETVAAAAPAAATAADEGESVYNGACVACHLAGVAGAPKLGDEAAWAPRIALGQDALVASVVNGKGAMPAKGGNASLSEAQIKAAVTYMVVKASPQAAAPAPASAASTAGAVVEKAVEATTEAATKAVEATKEAAGKVADSASAMASSAMAAATPAAGVPDASEGKPGGDVYNMGCVACHATGAANAPKLTDKAAWEGRAAAGLAALVASSVNGKGAMPAKGGLATLSEADVANAVRYMLEQAGVQAGG